MSDASKKLRSSLGRALFLTLILSITHIANAKSDAPLTLDIQKQDLASPYQLAQSYELGTDTTKNVNDAFYWYSQSADNGNSDAQFRLGEWYLTGTGVQQNNKLALEWFIKAALQGNKRAPIEVAKIYQSVADNEQNNPLNALDAAQVWYEAALQDNPDAEQGYNRILETQFNQQRAKQISSIKHHNSQIDSGLSDDSYRSNETNLTPSTLEPPLNVTIYPYWIGTLVIGLIVIVVITLILIILRKKQILKSGELEQQQSLAAQLSSKDVTIKQQKRQLQTLYLELKKQQSNNEMQHLHIACALFGYTPSAIPDKRSIKMRYKHLSKIYHPDGHGCDEEMKRLNSALKTILNRVAKT